MQKDSIQRTILVALGVCLVCSVLVSGAAVSLSSIQKENKRLDKVKNILIAGGLYDPAQDIQTVYDNKVVPLLVELDSGRIVGKDAYPEGMHAATYDLKKMASDPAMGRAVDAGEDIANIRKRPKYIFIYEVIENGKLDLERLKQQYQVAECIPKVELIMNQHIPKDQHNESVTKALTAAYLLGKSDD